MEAEIIENNFNNNTQNQLLNNNSSNLASAAATKLLQQASTYHRNNRTPSQITIKSILTPQTVREISGVYSPISNRIPTANSLKDSSINQIRDDPSPLIKMSLPQKTYEYDPDLFLSMMDDDVNLYKRYYPTTTTKFSRYLDFNDDALVLDRLKAKLEQRDFDMQKRVHDGKEINVLIDITTDGKKIRHQVKSRNSQNLTTNNDVLPRKSRNDNIINDEEIPDINLKGYAVKKRLNHQSLPTIPPRNAGIKSRKSDELLEISEDQKTPRNQRERETIHGHLYSLSKKENAGYFEAYKENQRRKVQFNNKKYTVEDYKRFTSNFGLGKDFFDLRDVNEAQKQERAKKRNDYAEYVQNRNSQMLNQMNPKDSLKAFIQSKNPVLRNTLLTNDTQRVKVF